MFCYSPQIEKVQKNKIISVLYLNTSGESMTVLELRPLVTLFWLSANYDLILETRCRTKAFPHPPEAALWAPGERKRGFSFK